MSNEPAPQAAPQTPASTPATPQGQPPAAGTQPQTPPAPQGDPAQPATPATPPAYKIPDAYKDKPWASKIKSEEDVFKQLDNLNTAVGKKHATPDFKTADPKEIEEFFNGLKPSDKNVYKFGDDGTFDADFATSVSDVLFNVGVPEHVANKLIPEYMKLEQARLEHATSAEGFEDEMKTSFGDGYDAQVKQIVDVHKAHLSPEDQALVEKMPNALLGVLYRLTNKMNADINRIKTEYGVKEGGDQAHTGAGNTPQPQDIGKVRSELRAKIREIEARPHTAEEVQKLKNDLHATYEKPKGK